MSRTNKVNPDHYKVAGRLSPDDLARERMKQNARQDSNAWYERQQPAATWASAEGAGSIDESEASTSGARAPRAGGAPRSGGSGRTAARGTMAPKTKTTGRAKKSVARRRSVALKASAKKRLPPKARATATRKRVTQKRGAAKAAKRRLP